VKATAAVQGTVDATLLSRIEDAGLNASAPPQQRWLDGWLLRFSPGKAKRARCINAVAEGRLPLAHKLELARAVYAEANLPLLVRITPFTLPRTLDAALARLGMATLDDTRVMVCPDLASIAEAPLPSGTTLLRVGHEPFAHAVGQLRGSPLSQRQAHAQRLALAPLPFDAYLLKRDEDGQVLACGQFAREAELVGLYDVFTSPPARGRGLAQALCRRLLCLARERGARVGYLQVDSDNAPARAVYRRLGFADAYAYHYRQMSSPPSDSRRSPMEGGASPDTKGQRRVRA
jgi:ribosomal protein S18 acetylase RimI-like enzyme